MAAASSGPPGDDRVPDRQSAGSGVDARVTVDGDTVGRHTDQPVPLLRGGRPPRHQPGRAERRDDGLFGPQSVTWRLMAEPVMWVAGVRALYLQALHPRTMRAVWQNSVFTDPSQAWARFLRTSRFVQIRHYGSTDEVAEAARRIRKIHASLTGVDTDGTRFRLDEPELLLWVHCGEIGSYVDVARRSGIPVSAGELDVFVDEQRKSAAVVGLDPATVPRTVAELDAYFAAVRPTLRACPEAKRALLLTYNPAALPSRGLPLRLAVPSINTLAFATLPRWARRLYGLPGSPLTDVAATAALRAARRATTGVPGRLLFEPAARAVFDDASRVA